MTDKSEDEDYSFDEGDQLMFRPRRESKILKRPTKLNILQPRDENWVKLPIDSSPDLNEEDLKKLRRHSSPIIGHDTRSPLPLRRDFTKLEVKIEEENNEEEGWKVREDGSFYYEEDDRITTRRNRRLSRDGHAFAKWQTKKDKKKGVRKHVSNKVSGMNRLVHKICNPSDNNLKLKIFLFFISLLIIGGVTTTWYFYHKKVLQAVLGRGIRIIEQERTLYLSDSQGNERLEGIIGQHIPKHMMPYDCQNLVKTSSICLKWKYRTKLKIFRNYTSDDIRCFRVEWESYIEKKLKDCFYFGKASWFGLGESYPQLFSVEKWKKIRSPFVTGDSYNNAFGSVLERYLLTSAGVSITIDNDVPLYVSVNEDDGKICLESTFEGYPYKKLNDSDMPFLRYNLCAGKDIRTVHEYIAKTYFSEHPQDQFGSSHDSYFSNAIWSTRPKLSGSLSHSMLLNFTNDIMQHGYKPGLLVIDEGWERHYGDLEFNFTSFPSIENTMKTMGNKGFHIILTVSPYISIKSQNFEAALSSGYLMFDSKQKMPMLARWKSSAVAVIDFSNVEAREWLADNLLLTMSEHALDGLSFVGGESLHLPDCYNTAVTSINPDDNNFEFRNFTSHNDFGTAMISLSIFRSFASKSSNCTPNILKLSPRRPTWDEIGGLKSVIPSVLTYGLFGNVLINIGTVGGDETGIKEDRELFIRWLQLAVFMPVFQFSIAPYDFDPEVEKIASDLIKIRQSIIVPYFKKYLDESFEAGFPLIRPLWWLSPNDEHTYDIDDQFVVHTNMIVAPILNKGQTKRNIYLPEGWWRDELSGTIRKGKKWIYNYEAELDKVPYFLWLEGAPIR